MIFTEAMSKRKQNINHHYHHYLENSSVLRGQAPELGVKLISLLCMRQQYTSLELYKEMGVREGKEREREGRREGRREGNKKREEQRNEDKGRGAGAGSERGKICLLNAFSAIATRLQSQNCLLEDKIVKNVFCRKKIVKSGLKQIRSQISILCSIE